MFLLFYIFHHYFISKFLSIQSNCILFILVEGVPYNRKFGLKVIQSITRFLSFNYIHTYIHTYSLIKVVGHTATTGNTWK